MSCQTYSTTQAPDVHRPSTMFSWRNLPATSHSKNRLHTHAAPITVIQQRPTTTPKIPTRILPFNNHAVILPNTSNFQIAIPPICASATSSHATTILSAKWYRTTLPIEGTPAQRKMCTRITSGKEYIRPSPRKTGVIVWYPDLTVEVRGVKILNLETSKPGQDRSFAQHAWRIEISFE